MFSGKKAAQRSGRELGKRLFRPVLEDFLEYEGFKTNLETPVLEHLPRCRGHPHVLWKKLHNGVVESSANAFLG